MPDFDSGTHRSQRIAHARGTLSAIPGALWAAIYLGVAAATLPAVLPLMVGIMTEQLAFGLERAGYVASFNMGGIALGSLIGAALTRRLSWRAVIVIGALIMITANVITVFVATFPQMCATRFSTGFGEGLIAGICYAAMGRSGQAARALAFYVAGQGLVGALGMGFLPTWIQRAGWQALFLLVSIVALPAFWLASRIDTLHSRPAPAAKRSGGTGVGYLGWAAVATLLAQFIGMSSIWAFLERLGRVKQIDSFHLSMALSASAIANMVGSLVVGVLAHRLTGTKGIGLAFALFLASLAGAFLWNEWQVYLVTGVLFMLAWAIYFPFQFGLLARFDRGGSLAAIMPAVTGVGFTIGPALGGMLLAQAGTGGILALGLGCMLVSTFGCLGLNRIGRST